MFASKKILMMLCGVLLSFCFVGMSFASSPVIFFSDMTDGPTTGFNGSSTQGAAVSIWGLNFGSSGTVTVGGQTLSSSNSEQVAEWAATTNPTTARGLQRITFYLNSSMSTGSTTIQVAVGGVYSNTVPFYVRNTGNIYFLDVTNGNDSYDGKETTHTSGSTGPWKTFGHVRATVAPGDAVYVRAGTYTAVDPASTYSGVLNVMANGAGTLNYANGTANNSITISAYPTEAPQIGDGTSSTATRFLVAENDSPTTAYPFNYWTFSKLAFLLYDRVLFAPPVNGQTLSEAGQRWIGNDVHITQGSMGSGFAFNPYGNLTYWYLYGNYFHDCGYGSCGTGCDGSYATYCTYIGGGQASSGNATVSNYIYVGWNEYYHISGSSFHAYGHVANDSLDNLYYHDNFIHVVGQNESTGTEPTGMVIGGGDPTGSSYAYVKNAYVYNNIITSVYGLAAKFTDGSAGSNGGNYYIYNNTFYNNALMGPLATVEIQCTSPAYLTFNNNILYTSAQSEGFWSNYGGSSANQTGSNNLWYNSSGYLPSWSSNSSVIGQNPQFVGASPATYSDFELQSGSPAKSAGLYESSVTTDFLGNTRPNPPSIGAYEYGGGGSSTYYSVTPSAGANGSIGPNTPQTVSSGSTMGFTVTPSSGYSASVGGTCGGTLSGNTYTTNPITANCTVTATFTQAAQYTVTSSAGANGTITPSGSASVSSGATQQFIVSPTSGYTASVGGTCGGSLAGNTYTTNAITGNCTVTASFSPTPSPSPSSISRLQGTFNSSGALVNSLAFPNSLTANSLLLVSVTWGAVSSTPTVSDSLGNSFSLVQAKYDSAVTQGWALFYAVNTQGAVADTINVSYASGSNYAGLIIEEFSGIASSSPLDGSAVQDQANITGGANTLSSGSFSTSSAGDLIYVTICNFNNNITALASGANFTSGTTVSSFWGYSGPFAGTEYLTQSSAGSIAGTFTTSNTSGVYAATIAAAFKATSSPVLLPPTGLRLSN